MHEWAASRTVAEFIALEDGAVVAQMSCAANRIVLLLSPPFLCAWQNDLSVRQFLYWADRWYSTVVCLPRCVGQLEINHSEQILQNEFCDSAWSEGQVMITGKSTLLRAQADAPGDFARLRRELSLGELRLIADSHCSFPSTVRVRDRIDFKRYRA
eukprot:6187731-Pleurochrysis_carterae.AAC.3